MAASAGVPLTIAAKSLKALKSFEWAPAGVCALVGPNGSGKSTAFKIVEMLRWSLEQGYSDGLRLFGSGPLRNLDSTLPPTVAIRFNSASWGMVLRPDLAEESGSADPDTRYATNGGEFVLNDRGMTVEFAGGPKNEVGLQRILRRGFGPPDFATLAGFIKRSRLFSRPELAFLREGGSAVGDDVALDASAKNLFTVLRNWRDQSEHEHRLEFVNEQLAEIFPHDFRKFDFAQAAQRQSASVVSPLANRKEKLQPTDWSDGFFCMLIHLAGLASVDQPGLIAIDEPENSLHPERIRQFVEVARIWSQRTGATVVLATHSPVLLDQFKEEPEKVFVMQSGEEQLPVQLDRLKKREWLQHFSLGDLYSHLEVGASPQ